MADVYLGDETITTDLYIGDDARFHVSAGDLELQTKIATAWITHQSWTHAYDGVWRLHADGSVVYLQEQNSGLWVTFTKWGN